MTVRQPLWLRAEDVPDLPKGWVALTTSEACEQLKPGALYSSSTTVEAGEVPVLSQGESGFVGYHNDSPGIYASLRQPVVTFANHTCAMRLMKYPYSCIQNIFSKIGKAGVCNTHYFYYATMGRVTISDYKGHHPLFRQAYIPIPPLETQLKIVSILSAYDDLIENNTRRIEILEEMARRLYDEWFVQFRFPGHEGVDFKESLPTGWAWVSIEDAADNFDRLRKPLSKMQRAGRSGSYPYYGAAKVFDYIDDYLFEGRYLLMAEDGSVITPEGHPVLQITHGRFWVNNHTHILKGRGPFSTEFIYLALSTYQIAGHITGAAQPKITQANMNRIPVLRATHDVHASFDAHIGPVFDLIETLGRKNANLRAQRDLLLPKLISGEIDVSNIPMPT